MLTRREFLTQGTFALASLALPRSLPPAPTSALDLDNPFVLVALVTIHHR